MLDKKVLLKDFEKGYVRQVMLSKQYNDKLIQEVFNLPLATSINAFEKMIDEIATEKKKNVFYGTFKKWTETTGEKIDSIYGSYDKQTKKIDIVIRKTFKIVAVDGTEFEVQFFPTNTWGTPYLFVDYHIVSADGLFTDKEKTEYMNMPGTKEKLNKAISNFILSLL